MSSVRLSYLSIPVTRLYELGSATLIKDKFRIQSDLGGLEKRSEKDSIRFCPTRSRGRHRMGRRPRCAHIYGERPGYVWGSRKREWGSGLLQIAVSQQCGTAVRKSWVLQGKAGRWHGAKAEGAALLRGRTGQTTSDGSSGEPFGLLSSEFCLWLNTWKYLFRIPPLMTSAEG